MPFDEMRVKTAAIVGNTVNFIRYNDYSIDQPVLFPYDRRKKEIKKTEKISAFLRKFRYRS